MTAERGAWVQRDSGNNGTTPKGARLAQGGGLARNGDSPLSVRRGVLWDGGGAIVSGTAGWAYQVRACVVVAMASSTNGPTVIPVSANVNVATDPAPGANSRIDVVWIRQKLVAGDGGAESTNEPEIGVTKGAVAASPVVPSIPSDALALAQITVTAGAGSTAALTVTRLHRWTAAAGGVIRVESSTERGEITLEGTLIHYVPDGVHQALIGGVWKAVGSSSSVPPHGLYPKTANGTSIANGSTVNALGGFAKAAGSSSSDIDTYVSLTGGDTFTILVSGIYIVSMRQKWNTNSSGHRHLRFRVNGVDVESISIGPGSSAPITVNQYAEAYRFNAGDVVTMGGLQTSGSALPLLGDGTRGNTYVYLERRGPL